MKILSLTNQIQNRSFNYRVIVLDEIIEFTAPIQLTSDKIINLEFESGLKRLLLQRSTGYIVDKDGKFIFEFEGRIL